MVFCGQCGYQLGPGDAVCPRCGAKTDADLLEQDPGAYNPTEISHALLDLENLPTRAAPLPNYGAQPRPPDPQGPLVLGRSSPNDQLANEATAMMSSQMYAPQAAYPGYPQQSVTGMYGGYPAGGYPQQYQAGQNAAAAQLLEASRKGKITSLLLILFGLLLLIGAIIVFLLNRQGILFS
jgi:hypothetical protein